MYMVSGAFLSGLTLDMDETPSNHSHPFPLPESPNQDEVVMTRWGKDPAVEHATLRDPC